MAETPPNFDANNRLDLMLIEAFRIRAEFIGFLQGHQKEQWHQTGRQVVSLACAIGEAFTLQEKSKVNEWAYRLDAAYSAPFASNVVAHEHSEAVLRLIDFVFELLAKQALDARAAVIGAYRYQARG